MNSGHSSFYPNMIPGTEYRLNEQMYKYRNSKSHMHNFKVSRPDIHLDVMPFINHL